MARLGKTVLSHANADGGSAQMWRQRTRPCEAWRRACVALVGGRLWFGGPSTAQDATSQRDPGDPRQSLRRQALRSTSSSLLMRGASNLLEPRGEKVHTNHSNCGVAMDA